MNLEAAVKRYLEVVGEFRRPMPLEQFGLPQAAVEAMVSAWDEDYHLHRHFELIAAPEPLPDGVYRVHGIPYTAIVFHESIRDALGQRAT